MFDMTTLMPMLALIATWIVTPTGSNALFACICAIAFCGANARLCLGLTFVLHLMLIQS